MNTPAAIKLSPIAISSCSVVICSLLPILTIKKFPLPRQLIIPSLGLMPRGKYSSRITPRNRYSPLLEPLPRELRRFAQPFLVFSEEPVEPFSVF